MDEFKIKSLSFEETEDLIEGIENGDIIICSPERTEEEEKMWREAIAKHRKEYWASMSFRKRITLKLHIRYLCYKYRWQDSKFRKFIKNILK